MTRDAEDIADDIAAVGETATLRRLAPPGGQPFDVVLRASRRAYQIQELTEAVVQGDQRVIISNREITRRQWPGPPRRGDHIVFSDGVCQIEGVIGNNIGDETVSFELQVRG